MTDEKKLAIQHALVHYDGNGSMPYCDLVYEGLQALMEVESFQTVLEYQSEALKKLGDYEKTLVAQIASEKQRADSAVYDLNYLGHCAICRHEEKCYDAYREERNYGCFKWRGVCKENMR